MEQSKVKFIISLPITAVLSIAILAPASAQAQGTNAWNTNGNSAALAAGTQPATQQAEKPKYYVEPTVNTPSAIVQNGAPASSDTRFAPDNLDALLAAGRNTSVTNPARPSYPQGNAATPQQFPGTTAARNMAPNSGVAPTAPAFPNPYAYNNAPQYPQQYAQQYAQQNGQQYAQRPGYGPSNGNGYNNGYNNGYAPGGNFGNYANGFPGGYNSIPGGGYGGFPSIGGFPGFGSPSTNFSPFGFW